MKVTNVYKIEVGKKNDVKILKFFLTFFIRVHEEEKICSSTAIGKQMRKRYIGFDVEVEKVPDTFYFGNTGYPEYKLTDKGAT